MERRGKRARQQSDRERESACERQSFDVGVTFEMREPNTEKSIFRLIKIAVSQHLLNERGKGKVAERQRQREKSEGASVGQY